MSSLTESAAWLALRQHAAQLAEGSIADLFAADAQRPQNFSAEAAGIYLDYSKQQADARALELLLALAQQQDLPGWIGRMFAGEAINQTEHRAAFHVALRAPRDAGLRIDGRDVNRMIRQGKCIVCFTHVQQQRDQVFVMVDSGRVRINRTLVGLEGKIRPALRFKTVPQKSF